MDCGRDMMKNKNEDYLSSTSESAVCVCVSRLYLT